MNAVEQFKLELSHLCDALEAIGTEVTAPEHADLCKQLWSLVYRAGSEEDISLLVNSLQSDLLELAQRSRTIAQKIESTLESQRARELLERPVPVSVAFHLSGQDSNSARLSSFESLLHGYPMAWARPRYSAELELLRAIGGDPTYRRVVVIGPSALPFTAVYFASLANINVTYFDPNPSSYAIGKPFVSKLEELGILQPGAVEIHPVHPTRQLQALPLCDAAFIVDQEHPHIHWLEELRRLNAPLIFCQDAVALARLVYQPLDVAGLAHHYILAGETVPAHATGAARGAPVCVEIQSTDVFLTTAAFRLRSAPKQ